MHRRRPFIRNCGLGGTRGHWPKHLVIRSKHVAEVRSQASRTLYRLRIRPDSGEIPKCGLRTRYSAFEARRAGQIYQK
jgi:hypothetical protein